MLRRRAPQCAARCRRHRRAVRGVGFQTVTLERPVEGTSSCEALRNFARQAEQADWALIYYAGHGIEMSGMNYLIPVDARLETDRDVQFEALPLDQVLCGRGRPQAADHPARRLPGKPVRPADAPHRRLAHHRPRPRADRAGRGHARRLCGKARRVALDGEGDNSPFVTALVKHIATPGVEINKLFRLVRDDVLAATGRRQEPFVYGSLPGEDFYFSPPLPGREERAVKSKSWPD